MNRFKLEIELVSQMRQMDELFAELDVLKQKINEKDEYIQKLRNTLGMNLPPIWDEESPILVYLEKERLGVVDSPDSLYALVRKSRAAIAKVMQKLNTVEFTKFISLYKMSPVDDVEKLKLQMEDVKVMFANYLQMDGEPIQPIVKAMEAFNKVVEESFAKSKEKPCGVGERIAMRGEIVAGIGKNIKDGGNGK